MRHSLTRTALTLLLTIAGLSYASAGADWIGQSYVNVNGTWYKASGNGDWATGGTFDQANLGNLTSLTIGAQIQVHASGNADWRSGEVAMNYKFDDDGTTTGWTTHTLSYSTYGGVYGNNMMYQSNGSSFVTDTIDISSLSDGTHVEHLLWPA